MNLNLEKVFPCIEQIGCGTKKDGVTKLMDKQVIWI